MAVIPNTNVNLATNVRDVLNAAGGSVTNDLRSFFKKEAKLDIWALFKPLVFSAPFTDNFPLWYKGDNGQCGYEFQWCKGSDVARVAYETISDYRNLEWSHVLPVAGQYMRLSDFRGYDTECVSPFANNLISISYPTNGGADSALTLGFKQQAYKNTRNFTPDILEIDGEQCSAWYPGLIFINSSGEMVAIVTSRFTMSEYKNYIGTANDYINFAPQGLMYSGDYTMLFVMCSKSYYGSNGYYKVNKGAFSDNDVYFAFFPTLPGTLTLVSPAQLFIHPKVTVSADGIAISFFATNLTTAAVSSPIINVTIDYWVDQDDSGEWATIASWENYEMERSTMPANSSNVELSEDYIMYTKGNSWPNASVYRVTVEGVTPNTLGDDEVSFRDVAGSVWG